jgi:hypothetical protein
MANFDTKEFVNEGMDVVVNDVVADKGVNLGPGAAIGLGVGLACAVIGVGKLIVMGVNAYKEKKKLNLVERGDLTKSEDTERDEESEE